VPATRRTFLTGGAAAGVGLAVVGAVPSLAQANPGRPHRASGDGHVPFPALVDDPDGILALPEGFRYAIVTRAGVTQLDGGQGLTPSGHDGMAAYNNAGRGRYTVIQNHEIDEETEDRAGDQWAEGGRTGVLQTSPASPTTSQPADGRWPIRRSTETLVNKGFRGGGGGRGGGS
jgi:hypothetical protein